MQPNWRVCIKCGAITKYSDVEKNLPDPETYVCPKCKKQKTGKVDKIGKVKEPDEKKFDSDGIEATKGKNFKSWKPRADKVSEVREETV